MRDGIFHDVISTMQSTFLRGDLASLVIAFGAVLIAAFLMRRSGQIASMTLLALGLFAAAGIFRSAFSGNMAGTGPGDWAQRFIGEVRDGWASLMDMRAGALIALFIAFMLVIFLVYLVRSRVSVNLAPGSSGHGGHGGGGH